MADIIKENGAAEEELEEDVVVLTDEDGTEQEFIVLGEAEIEGEVYMALEPVENPDKEFVILKQVASSEEGEIDLVDIEDEDEFDRVCDFYHRRLADGKDHELVDRRQDQSSDRFRRRFRRSDGGTCGTG